MNKPSGPSSALRLQLGLQNPLSYLTLLNSAWTIIPGELSERAKEFSLYIYPADACTNLHMVFDKRLASTTRLQV